MHREGLKSLIRKLLSQFATRENKFSVFFFLPDMERDMLEPLLQLCGSRHVTLSLLAMQCLSQLAQNPATFDQIVDNTRKHHLTKIVSLAAHKEEKVKVFTLTQS